MERHRSGSAGAIERTAPSTPPAENEAKRVVPAAAGRGSTAADEEEILVVVSKVRKYVSDKSGMNTSAGVYERLSDKIRNLCDAAIQVARSQGRKTVMDKDVL